MCRRDCVCITMPCSQLPPLSLLGDYFTQLGRKAVFLLSILLLQGCFPAQAGLIPHCTPQPQQFPNTSINIFSCLDPALSLKLHCGRTLTPRRQKSCRLVLWNINLPGTGQKRNWESFLHGGYRLLTGDLKGKQQPFFYL